MKTLIEKSIEIYGMGHPDTKTVFNIETEDERNHFRFKDLTIISGRKLSIHFKYSENDTEFNGKIQLVIPKTDSEEEIKNFILVEIQNYLN
jgi:hypothetical protein